MKKKSKRNRKHNNAVNIINNFLGKENTDQSNVNNKKEESKETPKPKKKSDIAKMEELFKKKLRNYDYVLHVVSGDGNCLFRSISDQVYGTDKHNLIIREKCMDYIEKNSLYYSQFIEGGEKNMKAYITRKRKSGVWGDNLEIQALSEIYKRHIEIYVNVDKPINSPNSNLYANRFPIKISYHGERHYNSMVPSVKNQDFALFKQELIQKEPGVYETEFIKNFDPNMKFNEMFFNNSFLKDNLNLDAIVQENFAKDEEFLLNEAIEDSKLINLNKINNNENTKQEDELEYLKNPIIQNAMDFGFGLTEAIEALKICGNNNELVINYLYDKK